VSHYDIDLLACLLLLSWLPCSDCCLPLSHFSTTSLISDYHIICILPLPGPTQATHSFHTIRLYLMQRMTNWWTKFVCTFFPKTFKCTSPKLDLCINLNHIKRLLTIAQHGDTHMPWFCFLSFFIIKSAASHCGHYPLYSSVQVVSWIHTVSSDLGLAFHRIDVHRVHHELTGGKPVPVVPVTRVKVVGLVSDQGVIPVTAGRPG
jgi:hypothetical protein